MSQFDHQYKELVRKVLKFGKWNHDQPGVRGKYSDGTPAYTKSIFFHVLEFGPEEVPLLTSRYVPEKSPIIEMIWIWIMRSNDVNLLEKMGCKYWNEWKQDDGTIGKAYGHQLAKEIEINGRNMDQVEYLINQLIENPGSRRIKTELWNWEDTPDMALTPCVHGLLADTHDGKLNLEITVRSSDIGLGLPNNVYQYWVWWKLLSMVTGIPMGKMYFVLGNAHIYDRHVDTLTEILDNPTFKAPTIYINPFITDIDDFSIHDYRVINYQYAKKYTRKDLPISE